MAEIVVTVVGLKELEAKFSRFPDMLRNTRRRALGAAVLHVQRKVQKYPPQQPSIRKLTPKQGGWTGPRGGRHRGTLGIGGYKRTFTLSRAWNAAVRLDGSEGTVGNAVKYAPYVQGSRSTSPGQSRVMQRKNWKSVDDVVKEEQKTVEEIFAREIRAMVKELS